MRVGVISDTHGLMRPQALAALAGVDHIIHGGDIGSEDVLRELEAIAPVAAVRGNNDTQAWARDIPEILNLQLGGISVTLIHDLKELRAEPGAGEVVISGHSHKPRIEHRGEVLFLNPGSAGPRRFKLPVTLAILEIADGRARAEILPLLPD